MVVKVVLDRRVRWFVKRECSEAEQDAFYAALESVLADPVAMIEQSEALHDPKLSRYMLRFFRFADCVAIFETNRGRDRIRVIECRRPPHHGSGQKPPLGSP